MTADRTIGLFFALLGLAILYFTQSVANNFPGSGDPGPQLLPNILGGLMALLGIVLALRAVPSGGALPQDTDNAIVAVSQDGAEGPTTILPPPSLARRIGIAAAFVLFIALFERLGFSLAAFLFLAVAMSLMDELAWRRVAARSAVALVVVVIVGLVVTHGLNLSVPGVWFG